ncbi:hypothetical protein FCM35_KLT04490 [Carex littledalei]|uniref:Uncharacterized protein n=1 Tax=Carex littledalei TaxID=544730 RepID=A0A833VAN2_9POAL|nr:hypothetical protein FCM35_KLT04490 [Carex littledalei]
MMLKLLQKRRRKGEWMVAKEVATKLLGLYISQRRSTVRKFTWGMVWFQVRRRSVGLVRDRHVAKGYDSVISYARNFDDGLWKEEVEHLRSRSFVYRFGDSGRLVG